jgi:hypothetical protein
MAVLALKPTAPGRVDVVDGQQRLTTIIILLKCLETSLPASDKNKAIIQKMLIKHGSMPILNINQGTSFAIFDNFIRGIAPLPTPTAFFDKRLIQAINFCKKFVGSWGGTTQELFNIITNQLDFVEYNIPPGANEFGIFETMNSRGKSVSDFENLKSYLIGGDSAVKIIWQNIYSAMEDNEIFGEYAMSFYATEKAGGKSKYLTTNESLRMLKKSIIPPCDISNGIKGYIDALNNFVKARPIFLFAIKEFKHLAFLAAAIQIKFPKAVDVHDEFERIGFLISYLTKVDTRKILNSFVELTQDVLSGKYNKRPNSKITLLAQIADLPRKNHINKTDVHNQIDIIINNYDCYGKWWRGTMYLLYKYEQELSGGKMPVLIANAFIQKFNDIYKPSAEHIYPSSWLAKKDPAKYIGTNTNASIKPKEIYVNGIQNLLGLPLWANMKLPRGSAETKCKTAEYQTFFAGREIDSIITKNGGKWDRHAYNLRGDKMRIWLKSLYKI